MILHSCLAFDHLFLFLKTLEEVRESLVCRVQVRSKLAFFFQKLLDFDFDKFLLTLHCLLPDPLKLAHDFP